MAGTVGGIHQLRVGRTGEPQGLLHVPLRLLRHGQAAPGIGADRAPAFHYYLYRHIRMDEDLHGPLSMSLLAALCGDDPQRIEEAETAAEEAVCARIRFWDGVLEAIEARRAG